MISLGLLAGMRFNNAAIFAVSWNMYLWLFIVSLVVVLTFQPPSPTVISNTKSSTDRSASKLEASNPQLDTQHE